MNDILSEISDAADDLEDGLDDNLFEDIGLEQRKVSSSLLPDLDSQVQTGFAAVCVHTRQSAMK